MSSFGPGFIDTLGPENFFGHPPTDEDLAQYAGTVCERMAKRIAPGGSLTLERLPERDEWGNLFYLTVREPLK